MTTSARPYARYTGLIGATGLAEVRSISGLPTHLYLTYFSAIMITFGFSFGIVKKVYFNPKAY
jgi:hypothetical protein